MEPDKYKDIVINSLRFLVEDKRIKLYAFVIMSNHIHLIRQMQPLINPQIVQRDFLKYTAQRIKHDPGKDDPALLMSFESDTNDLRLGWSFFSSNRMNNRILTYHSRKSHQPVAGEKNGNGVEFICNFITSSITVENLC